MLLGLEISDSDTFRSFQSDVKGKCLVSICFEVRRRNAILDMSLDMSFDTGCVRICIGLRSDNFKVNLSDRAEGTKCGLDSEQLHTTPSLEPPLSPIDSMHYAITVPDILQEILGNLRLGHEPPPCSHFEDSVTVAVDKFALVNLAYTCQAMSCAALPLLWKHMRDLKPLLRLIPEYTKFLEQSNDSRSAGSAPRHIGRIVYPSSKLASPSLERFSLYAQFVRDFRWTLDDRDLDLQGYLSILSGLPHKQQFVFPELHHLHIVHRGGQQHILDGFNLIIPLLAPVPLLRRMHFDELDFSPSLGWNSGGCQLERLTYFKTSIRSGTAIATFVISIAPNLRQLVLEHGALDQAIANAISATRPKLSLLQCAQFIPAALAQVLSAVKASINVLQVTTGPVNSVHSRTASSLLPLFVEGFPVLQKLALSWVDSNYGRLARLCQERLPSLNTLSLQIRGSPENAPCGKSLLSYFKGIVSSSQMRHQISSLRLEVEIYHMSSDWSRPILDTFPNLKSLCVMQSDCCADYDQEFQIGSFVAYIPDKAPDKPSSGNLRDWDCSGHLTEKSSWEKRYLYDPTCYDVYDRIFGFQLFRR